MTTETATNTTASAPISPDAWATAESRVDDWFADRGWTPFDYQRRVWEADRKGKSGLVNAPTGTGKTYSVWFAALMEWMAETVDAGHDLDDYDALPTPPLSVVWVTPLRALSHNTVGALDRVCRDLRLPWRVEGRTGDTSYRKKKGQLSDPPSVLVTTPESLSILLSYPDTKQHLRALRMVVVDEWHELMGSKRGVQTELGLARLRRWNPTLRTWGLSATIGNMDEARTTLLGNSFESEPTDTTPNAPTDNASTNNASTNNAPTPTSG